MSSGEEKVPNSLRSLDDMNFGLPCSNKEIFEVVGGRSQGRSGQQLDLVSPLDSNEVSKTAQLGLLSPAR